MTVRCADFEFQATFRMFQFRWPNFCGAQFEQYFDRSGGSVAGVEAAWVRVGAQDAD